jgi:hypothetical protein
MISGQQFSFFANQQNKQQCFRIEYHLVSSMVECTPLESHALRLNLEKITFCWNGFCKGDCFKHSEAKWHVLPSLLSKALETGPTVYKSDAHRELSSKVLLPMSSRFSRAISWSLT